VLYISLFLIAIGILAFLVSGKRIEHYTVFRAPSISNGRKLQQDEIDELVKILLKTHNLDIHRNLPKIKLLFNRTS